MVFGCCILCKISRIVYAKIQKRERKFKRFSVPNRQTRAASLQHYPSGWICIEEVADDGGDEFERESAKNI